MRVSLRSRLVASTLLPLILVVTGLTGMFAYRHLADLDEALDQRGRALARQASVTAEFNLFSGNSEALQSMAMGMLRSEEDATGIAVVDAGGTMIAQAGLLRRKQWPDLEALRTRDTGERIVNRTGGITVLAPVVQRRLDFDDAYSGEEITVASRQNNVLGHVILEFSDQRLVRDRERLILLALVTGLVGAVLGGTLALRIARGISHPLLEATDVVERIGHGDLAARVSESHSNTLGPLAQGINAMANRIALTQDQLGIQIQEATSELIVQRDAAERATQAKSRFLAAASHDLRQPMHALGLFVSRLTRMSWSGEQRGLIHHVENSVAALQEMLDTLLDISRLDAGAARTNIKSFAITPILERVSRDLAPLAYEKQLVLRLRTRPLCATSDPRLVERIVLNLISNAIRHTDKGRVVIACRSFGKKLRLQVWDTGNGIAQEMQESIFDEYVQVGNEERDRNKGLGLGLAICQRIAKLLETKINVRSIPGRGSVFWVDLPLCEQESTVPEVLPIETKVLDRRVLVVDDDALCRDATAEVLREWGAYVTTAVDADDAMARARRSLESGTPPRIAICDLRLPGSMDGIALSQELRKLDPAIRIVLVTADVTPALQAVARRSGFPVLKKPVAPARLRATLLALR